VTLGGGLRFVGGPLPPTRGPFVEGARIGEQFSDVLIPGGIKRGIAEAYVKLYTAWNRPEDAAAWQAKLPAK